ncbi:MAG TPA: hypothetical protein VFZ53_32160 [Polyangiaceae bacterium]
MTVRRSERPAPGKALSKATPGRGVRRTPSYQAPPEPKQKSLNQTWPLFGQQTVAFPADPATAVHELEPPSSALAALAAGTSLLPDDREKRARRLPQGLPADAPEWMRAARALSNWLEERIERGSIPPADQAAVARTWAAFCLGGSTESQILKVAHLVQRAHTAIRSTPRGQHDLQAAYHAAAGVLHAALPTAVRERMPLERAVHAVRKLRDEADSWAAIVEGTSELLGWKDHARTHAATVIRALLEQHRKP